MTTSTTAPNIAQPPGQKRGTFSKRFNWNYFLQDNITGSRLLTISVILLAVITLGYAVMQLGTAPGRTQIIVGVWAVAVFLTVIGELFTLHSFVTRWLKENMFNSVINVLVTLLVSLLVGQVASSLWDWGYVNATFDPALTAHDVRSTGASWGVIWGARKLWLTGLLSPDHTWRVLLSAGMVLGLWLLTFIATRSVFKNNVPIFNRFVNFLWILSPVVAYIFLAGIEYVEPLFDINTIIIGTVVALSLMFFLWFFKVIQLNFLSVLGWLVMWPIAYVAWRLVAQTGMFPPINVDDWGGLLLTIIFAIFVNILSFPIGILLALGRRAEVQGIPSWIIWPVAVISTAYFLLTSTPELWETSRNGIERLMALWPLLIVIAAYYFHYTYEGNVVKAFSILSIEIIRGVPLITLLFMAIIMAPFFLSSGSSVKNFWAVIVGYTIFSSSYMAELVRGGLQAIPSGQYEASDSLGLNALQKYRFIVLPQALRILIPPLAGAVIGTFKSSSLVALVGIIDLVGAAKAIIANQDWLGLRSELYAFMFVLYFLVSAVVSAYSRRLEERTGLGVR